MGYSRFETGMDMNRETSIYSSDSLVVGDGSRARRRMIIIAAIAVLALFVVGLAVVMGRNSGDNAAAKGGNAAQARTVTVVVPGRSQVGGTVTASGPLAAKRDQPVGVAGQGGRVVRVLVDSGAWVSAGQVL